MMGWIAVVAVFTGVLVAIGSVVDGTRPLPQPALFLGLHIASLGGVAIGAGLAKRIVPALGRGLPGGEGTVEAPARWIALLAALAAWRLAYFPIMVFSGHVASIGEWLLIAFGLTIVVYPLFLLSVFAIHTAAGLAAVALLRPPHRFARPLVGAAFAVAAAVSFNQWSDVTLLPDRVTSIDAPVPAMRPEADNPYLPALVAPGYWPNQRVVLVAAGLTYETIPPSPWATSVKAVLEGLFHEKPYGSTADRVLEHYLAYHSAHAQIGCRALADCPPQPRP